jgi:GNAT superfamily N-acetyltransferase
VSLRIVTVRPGARAPFAAGIAALEEGTSYPLGDDRFELNHGADYFAFFDRLGRTSYDVALDGDRAVAVSARVLRERPFRCWYLCDLKVHPDYRGQRIASRFARHAFLSAFARCQRGYAVTMNEAGGGENRVERLVRRLPLVPFQTRALNIFSLDANQMADLRPLIERHRGPTSFLSLAGKKEIVLESTGAPIPLLHVQFGPCAETGTRDVRRDHVHMLCAPTGDDLTVDLRGAGLAPSATATVLHHRMRGSDFEFILTSDI